MYIVNKVNSLTIRLNCIICNCNKCGYHIIITNISAELFSPIEHYGAKMLVGYEPAGLTMHPPPPKRSRVG